ncbi:MAG: ferredoxin [Hyphomicrobiaceae bacterium]
MSQDTPKVRLVVDSDRCQGHNRCNVLLPELIQIDDYGFAHVPGTGAVPPALAEKARLAVRNCPEFALKLEPITDEGRSA